MNNYHWTSEQEAAYLEERKNKCEHCHPEHEDTSKWLENVTNQDLLYAVYKEYGINPGTVYREYEAELISIRIEERIVPALKEEVA